MKNERNRTMKHVRAIEVLQAKQEELEALLEDRTLEKSAKLNLAEWYDELSKAIDVLERAASIEEYALRESLRVPIKWNGEKLDGEMKSISVTLIGK